MIPIVLSRNQCIA